MVEQLRRIGFIGIGTMGKPMSLNLIKAGYPLMAYDLNPKPLEELRANGAVIGQSTKEVAGQSDIIITMLPKSEDVAEVLLGDQGVIGGVKSSSIIIVDMSTIDASVSRNIAQVFLAKHIKMLDAPVSGGYLRAETGTLSIMVGGDEKIYQECLDIFKAMGKNIFYCGPNGNGAVVKIVNNLLGAIQAAATAEILSIGVKAGVEMKVLTEVIGASSGTNDFIRFAGPAKAFKGDFEPGFTVDLMYKDLGLAMTLAKEQGVPTLLGALIHQMYLYLKSSGLEKKDFSIIVKMFEDLMNVRLRL
ncbi:MAG TPA: NAD(P)-dependent oxidoreductase [Saprospiraceae bacterium]|nr:NAD(P)-dependent oxidoreductase [Saprospiraceae bacterium]